MTHRNLPPRAGLILAVVLSALSLAAHPQSVTPRGDLPAAAFLARGTPGFMVQRDERILGFFTEVSGIGSENEVLELREGGENGIVRKIPGRLKYSNITLKRGITRNLDLWEWREEVVNGGIMRSTVLVTLVGARGETLAQWHFTNAWPSKVEGPQLGARGNTVAIETLTLSHEGMARVQ